LHPAKYYPKNDPDKTLFEIQKERDYHAREYMVAVEEVKILQQQLRECYVREGVNHLELCKDLRETLWKKLNTPNYGAPGPVRSTAKVGAAPLPK